MVDPGCHTRAYHFSLSLFTSFSLFRVLLHLTWIPTTTGTYPDFYLSGTRPDPTFLVLAQIPSSRNSLGSYIFWYSPEFLPLPVLARISTFPVLARIPHFWYSSRSHLPGTRPNPTIFGTHPDFYLSGTCPDFYPFRHSPRYLPSRYLPGSHLSGTRPDFYPFRYSPGLLPFPVLAQISTLPVLARILSFSVLAQISTFPVLARIPYFWYSPPFYLL